jgi:class 3 adenylate cyclase
VPICASCGRASEGEFRFCPYCAAPLGPDVAPREYRKTVTVLFCDVTGSTALGESTDPEALRSLLARYFERMKGIVESHGGTVEKFIGDAVMAVFGVPRVHEDDALRAVRAAQEMRAVLPELGVEARIGVNTGEVVTGTEERLATGDAVNVAARLEQAAQPNEILFGEATLRLVREAVEAEAVEPLELKGKAKSVTAYRLLAVGGDAERRHEGRFVGRKHELHFLAEAWERASSERSCLLVTVIGDAGVGKSRLAAEFLADLDARVVHGRCLSYGEGITYWPVVAVVKQLGALPSDPVAAQAIRSLLGETEQGTSAEEIAWAFRKLLEERAPLVCIFEDIHWAEESFLDLIEHIALLSGGAPILLVCLARPEVTERRPQWPVALRLEPLSDDEANALLPATISAELSDKIARAAGGNPLFLTEMAAMATGAIGELAVPPNLHALLAARLERLDIGERSVLERGAVEGEIFHRGAVQAMSDDGQVTPRLAALVRWQLIRPDTPLLPAEDAFRFRHLLIRDAAYDALPKASRADLHERFVAWLEERGRSLVELDEIVGHHLAQAARYRAELGHPDPGLAERAAERLTAAGRRALWRGDNHAAASLLERALELTRPLRLDVVLELDLAQAVHLVDARTAAGVAEAAADRARALGDQAAERLARTLAAFHRAWFTPDPDIGELERLARETLLVLDPARDHAALVHVWEALGLGVANFRGRWDDWAHAGEQARRYAMLGGHPGHLFADDLAIASGTKRADDALEALATVRPDAPHPGTEMTRAWLLAMLGRSEEAWPLAKEARDRIWELSGAHWVDWIPAWIAALEGDHESAVGYLVPFCELLEARDQRFYLSSIAGMLGRELCAVDRYEDAEQYVQLVRDLGVRQSALGEALWRQVRALVLASRGEHPEAEEVARQAIAIIEQTDGLNYQGDAYCDLADVLVAAGRTGEAAEALGRALERYERKKNVAMLAQVKPKLDALRKQAPA